MVMAAFGDTQGCSTWMDTMESLRSSRRGFLYQVVGMLLDQMQFMLVALRAAASSGIQGLPL